MIEIFEAPDWLVNLVALAVVFLAFVKRHASKISISAIAEASRYDVTVRSEPIEVS